MQPALWAATPKPPNDPHDYDRHIDIRGHSQMRENIITGDPSGGTGMKLSSPPGRDMRRPEMNIQKRTH